MAAVTIPLAAPSSRPNMPAMPTTTLTPGAPRVSDSGEVRRSLSFRVPSVPAMKAVAAGSAPKIAAQVAQHFGPADVGASGIAHRAQSLAGEDFFEALGLPDGASVEAVRAAYFRLAKLWHPDRLPEDLAAFTAEVHAIFDHMTRAHATLTDAHARGEYLVTREKDPIAAAAARAEAAAFAARPRSEIVREIEQAIGKRDFTSAEATALRLAALDAEDADAEALLAWIAVSAGEGPEDALSVVLPRLDAAIKLDAYCERAHYYRGVLHKRLGNGAAAFRDFTRTLQMNPKHVDAQREVRIMEMRARKGSGEHALDLLVSKAKKK
jgi:curved DNA-binding protein CbpA